LTAADANPILGAMAALRVWALGLLAMAAWLLSGYATPHPLALGSDAPAGEFSAARAEAVLARILAAEKPHPAGTIENDAMHARVTAELAQLGITPQIITGTSCFSSRRGGVIACAKVSDLVAEAIPGRGKAIFLMAHLDSVAAGPGAADDASGVATVMETIRALKADTGASGQDHPVIVLFTNGEEAGLLGARLFLNDPAWRSRIGVVVNAEARGNQGPSYLFQTGGGDARLIDLYAANAVHPATSSLYSEIYRYLPNDTDFTPFLEAGYTGYNFAFIGDAAQYHTALDTRRDLDPASLQSQGDNVLGVARGLRGADFASLKDGNAIYFDVMKSWLPRLPAVFALPLSVLIFAAIALAGWLSSRGRPRRRGGLVAILMPPLFLLGALAAGFALEEIASLIAGDAPLAYPLALRLALAAGVWAFALLTMRGAGATLCWLWLAGLGVAAAVFAPGLSPYFLFPGAIAAVLLLLTAGYGRAFALMAGALLMLLVWIGFAAEGEAIMGIAAHPLFTIPAAIGLIALLPLMRMQGMGEGARTFSVLLAFLAALAGAVVAGLEPSFSASAPERLNLRYVEKDGSSWWLADAVPHLPPALRSAAAFSGEPEVLAAWRGYIAKGGVVQLPSPSATVSRDGLKVTLDLHGSASADGMVVIAPQGLSQAIVNGTVATVVQSGSDGMTSIACAGHDCADAHMVLKFRGAVPKSLMLAEERYGLPADAGFLLKARPDWAAPSGQGDLSLAVADVMVPAGP
jgi:hypothetical protein